MKKGFSLSFILQVHYCNYKNPGLLLFSLECNFGLHATSPSFPPETHSSPSLFLLFLPEVKINDLIKTAAKLTHTRTRQTRREAHHHASMTRSKKRPYSVTSTQLQRHRARARWLAAPPAALANTHKPQFLFSPTIET